MDSENLVISFIDCDEKYYIPVEKIREYPDSYFMAHINFTKELDCLIEVCSHEEFKNVYDLIMNDNIELSEYIRDSTLLDYFGIKSNLINSALSFFNKQYQKIHKFVKSQDDKYFLVRGFDEYIEYKKLFSSHKHIIPFQYVNKTCNDMDNVSSDDYFLDALFIGNGELCDFGSVNFGKENFMKNVFSKFKDDRYNPKGLAFDWLSCIKKKKIKSFYKNFDKYMDDNDDKYEADYRHCCWNMEKNYGNEIEYIIHGITHTYFENEYNNYHSRWIPKNIESLEKIIETHKNLNLANNYILPNYNLNDFKIREDICKEKYAPILKYIVYYDCCPDSYLDEPIMYNIIVNSYFGFINVS
ncbi:hypothetical protein ma91 [Moumouvirus australiensis]|uniref:Uncharacterized protein n=1 Tax=Moumouvirus australiensis TaxID=2109587 RepID=A0A2P1EKR0_9VIRU|nr:hypothetical protein QKC55_gp812 [Moumouvirus australiensis]AVL94478.1 hypothetical protein ma91 [Moumouvirus australiensis]